MEKTEKKLYWLEIIMRPIITYNNIPCLNEEGAVRNTEYTELNFLFADLNSMHKFIDKLLRNELENIRDKGYGFEGLGTSYRANYFSFELNDNTPISYDDLAEYSKAYYPGSYGANRYTRSYDYYDDIKDGNYLFRNYQGIYPAIEFDYEEFYYDYYTSMDDDTLWCEITDFLDFHERHQLIDHQVPSYEVLINLNKNNHEQKSIIRIECQVP